MAMHITDPTPSPDRSHGDGSAARVDVADHALTLFVELPPLIAAMVADIQQATTRVWMESYIFANDAAGRAIADALAERARAGLDVRLMVDAWGSFSTPASFWRALQASGVRVHVFHGLGEALSGRLRFLRVLNQRNHRKLLVIDEHIAYFGGMNVVDTRSIHSKADARDRGLPASAGWRDVHVRMVGPRQSEIAAFCERLWQRVDRERAPRRRRWTVREMLAAPQDSIFFYDSSPAFKYRRPQRILVPLIQRAQREITLSTAYFVPVGRVLGELLKARKRAECWFG